MLAPASKAHVRFRLSPEKCIQGIDLIASRLPGVTQYYVCKIFYFADKEHFLDWGRPISGDRFVAMEHGPVPSFIYNLLKFDSGQPDEVLDALADRVDVVPRGNRLCVHSLNKNDYNALSESDISYLESAIAKYGKMSFARVREISHDDPAYEQAWEQPGLNNEMDVRLWLDDPEAAHKELEEKRLFSVVGAIS